MQIAPVPYLCISGSRASLGTAVGEEFKQRILDLLAERTGILLSLGSGRKGELERICRLGWKSVARFTPEICTEVTATATAIGCEPHRMLIAGGYTDLIDSLKSEGSLPVSECSIGVVPRLNALFGTWDSHPSAANALVLVQRRLENGLISLALTTAGWPAQQGVNSRGVAFAITNLSPRAAKADGLNYIAANAILAESDTIDDFAHFAARTPFASGHSYITIDESGNSRIFETTSTGSRARSVGSPAAKTNHYESSDALDDNSAYSYLLGSQARHAEMVAAIPAITEPKDFEAKLLGSRYINKSDPTELAYTCARFYISAIDRSIHYAKGPADGSTLFRASIT